MKPNKMPIRIRHREFFTPFSLWASENMPQYNFAVFDIDMVLFNEQKKRLMLIEEKCRRADVAPWFHRFVSQVIHPALKKQCAESGIDYRGFHLIQFEKERPDDGGKIWLDRKLVTAEELRIFLAMDEENEEAKVDEIISVGRNL